MAIAKLLYDTSSNGLCNAELVLLSTILLEPDALVISID